MSKIQGKLTLIPTPIAETGPLEPIAYEILKKASTEEVDTSIFVIEDLKPGRRRWLSFGLTRDVVDNFVLYNEHTRVEAIKNLLSALRSGKNVYLMSDGGLPAFYDPGVELVNLCHDEKIQVTATPFFNSVVLAMALSGFNHQKFWFEGFLPLDNDKRIQALKSILTQKNSSILMDTPYRLKRVLEEMQSIWGSSKKKVFVAMDLGSENEELRRGSPKDLLGQISDFKREFVIVVSE